MCLCGQLVGEIVSVRDCFGVCQFEWMFVRDCVCVTLIVGVTVLCVCGKSGCACLMHSLSDVTSINWSMSNVVPLDWLKQRAPCSCGELFDIELLHNETRHCC